MNWTCERLDVSKLIIQEGDSLNRLILIEKSWIEKLNQWLNPSRKENTRPRCLANCNSWELIISNILYKKQRNGSHLCASLALLQASREIVITGEQNETRKANITSSEWRGNQKNHEEISWLTWYPDDILKWQKKVTTNQDLWMSCDPLMTMEVEWADVECWWPHL